jgi:hypothetical protein
MFKNVCTFLSCISSGKSGVLTLKKCLHSKPNFTKNNYNIIRGNYSHVEEEHLYYFRKLLGETRIVTDLSDLEKYNVDWHKSLRGIKIKNYDIENMQNLPVVKYAFL